MPRVLITGGAGFIGSHLAQILAQDHGWEVRVLDTLEHQVHGRSPESESPTFRRSQEFAEFKRGSVTDRRALTEALDGVDAVVHLAAETGTGQSMYSIAHYADINVGGTAMLLDILRNSTHTVTKVVVASSRSIYGEGSYQKADGEVITPAPRTAEALARGQWELCGDDGAPLQVVPTSESARPDPASVYAVTKLTQEQLVMTSCPAMSIVPVALRYQNVYGPGQALSNPYTGILSIFSGRILNGEPIFIFEDGLESRDFVHVRDVAAATAAAVVGNGADGRVVNVGTGRPTTVTQVVDGLLAAYGREVPVKITGEYRLGDIRHNVADTTALRDLLDPDEFVPFDTGIRDFASWVTTQPTAKSAYEESLQELRVRGLLK